MARHIESLKFSFITEDGESKLTIGEYHTRQELMAKVGLITTPTDGRATVFCGTTILSLPQSVLAQDNRKNAMFQELEDMVRQNPIKYFVPQNDDIRDFLNDTEHNLKGLIAPNGVGKSCCTWIDVALDILPCDPSWPIFSVHGVKHRNYKGPRTNGGVGIVTYEWNNHISTIWPQIIRRWTPIEHLGDYAEGGKAIINWKNNPRMKLAGTPVWFFACSQAQTVFEASAMDIYWWDEQGEESKFNGANMRIRRRNGRHVMSLTPHRVEGRPDTGAGSWIHSLYLGKTTAGLRPKFYSTSISDIPDWIYSQNAKKEAIKEWIEEPTENSDTKKLREGMSRIYGEFHESSGLVFDEFIPNIHLIPRFDMPEDWTKYRYVDHGRVEPAACIWVAVSPEGERFIYKEYYKKDLTASENAKGIVEASGNKVLKMERFQDIKGSYYDIYEEDFVTEQYFRTRMDSRSFAKKTDNSLLSIGKVYRNAGLNSTPADGKPTTVQVVVAKEMFLVDPEKRHYITREPGAPGVYIFDDLSTFIWELKHYVNETSHRYDKGGTSTLIEKPRARDDHLMACLLFMAMDNPQYVHGASNVRKVDSENEVEYNQRRYDRFTGY